MDSKKTAIFWIWRTITFGPLLFGVIYETYWGEQRFLIGITIIGMAFGFFMVFDAIHLTTEILTESLQSILRELRELRTDLKSRD